MSIASGLAKGLKKGKKLPDDTASRMARAKEQGFDKDTYHYSVKSDDIKSIREGDINKSLFMLSSFPNLANKLKYSWLYGHNLAASLKEIKSSLSLGIFSESIQMVSDLSIFLAMKFTNGA